MELQMAQQLRVNIILAESESSSQNLHQAAHYCLQLQLQVDPQPLTPGNHEHTQTQSNIHMLGIPFP